MDEKTTGEKSRFSELIDSQIETSLTFLLEGAGDEWDKKFCLEILVVGIAHYKRQIKALEKKDG